MALQEEKTYAALIGIDGADQQHDYCLGVVGSEAVEIGVIASRPEDVAAWITKALTALEKRPSSLVKSITVAA